MTASNDHVMEKKENSSEIDQDHVIPSYKVHRCRFINYAPNSINVTGLSPLGTFPYLAVGRSNGDIELWNILNDWHLERKIPGGSASSVEALVWSSFGVFDEDDDEEECESEKEGDDEDGNGYNEKKNLSNESRVMSSTEKSLVIDPLDKVPTLALENIRHTYGAKKSTGQPKNVSSKNVSPKAMARLFSAGLSGQITEWDLVTLKPKSVSDSYGGPVWAMSLSNDQQTLAVSCEDGAIRLFKITSSSLEYFKTFDRQPGRALSLAWHPTDRTLVSGSSEGVIRVWDAAAGRTIQRITVESFQEQPTFVWSVLCLANGTIVSGDSLGHVQFWDATTFTLSQTFTSHEADVLALAASTDGNIVYASGVDFKICQFKRSGASKTTEWIATGHRRAHTHDVRSLIVSHFPFYPALISGGVDTNILVHDTRNFTKRWERRISSFPQRPIIQISKSKHQLLVHFDHSLQLWSLGKMGERMVDSSSHLMRSRVDVTMPNQLLFEIDLKKMHNLTAIALSENAKWIVASTRHEIRIFYYHNTKWTRMDQLGDRASLKPSKQLLFSEDSSKLFSVSFDNRIQILNFSSSETLEELIVIEPFSFSYGNPMSQWIASICCSSDNRYFAVSSLQEIKVYDMHTFELVCSPANYSASDILSVTFHPIEPILIITSVSNAFFLYDIESRSLNSWSDLFSDKLPPKWLWMKEKCLGLTVNPQRPKELLFWGVHFMCWFALDRPLHYHNDLDESISEKTAKSLKRTRLSDIPEVDGDQSGGGDGDGEEEEDDENDEGDEGIKTFPDRAMKSESKEKKQPKKYPTVVLTHAYRPLLYSGFVDDGSLVIVEKSWISILKNLPPAFQRSRYGS